MAKVAGICFLTVDGQNYSLRGDLVVSLGETEKEMIAGLDGIHGYKETPRVPFIEGNITDTDGLDITALEKLDNVTVTVQLINEKTGILSNATQMKALELKVDDGTIGVRFEGLSGEWLKP